MTTPTISVLLPLYNAAGTVADSLESLRRQTLATFEVLVIDDGSTDASAAIAELFATRDPRFRVVRRPHEGVVSALRYAVGQARGTMLARMDADDIAHPERFAWQKAYLDAHPECGLVGSLVHTFGGDVGPGRKRYDAWINALITPEAMERELLVECPIAHPSFLMRRESYDGIGGYRDFDGPEDYDLVLRLVRSGWALGKVDAVLLHWRHTDARLSHVSGRYAPDRFRALKREHLFQTVLNGRDRFYQWGAGVVGKAWLREWEKRRPEAVVDVHPRKIGRSIHGTPVIAADELPPPSEGITVVAVGAPGARQEIRCWFSSRGYVEGRDFLFLA